MLLHDDDLAMSAEVQGVLIEVLEASEIARS